MGTRLATRIKKALRMYQSRYPVRDICETTGISISTLYAALFRAGIPTRTAQQLTKQQGETTCMRHREQAAK